ncbi:MAG: methionine biosynthesis protein MetW [Patescibacteria group bacterium]|nr:methionine biosynthesis protein MetW [Patescibacteria group bacterium]
MFKFPWIRKPDFKQITLNYNEYWDQRGLHIKQNLRPREEIIFNSIPTQATVIDIGCGNSALPIKLKSKLCDVTVLDISDMMLREYNQHGIKTIIANIELLAKEDPLRKFKYNWVVLSEILEHVRNPEEVITYLKTHVDNFAITIPNSALYWFRLGLLINGRFFTQWVHHPSEHLRFWSHIDFLDWLDAMGLKVEKAYPSNGPKHLKDFWPNMFGFQIVYICSKK